MVVTISRAGLGTGGAFLSNVTWETLEKLDADLAGTGTRLTYLDACLEILAFLSEDREEPQKTLDQLLEIYMRMKNLGFYARGSTTIGIQELDPRKEPDESYCLGTRKSVPDLAIEVTVTSSGIDTLEIYPRVGVQEVLFWEAGVISVYCLRPTGCELVSKSELLPEFGFAIDRVLFADRGSI